MPRYVTIVMLFFNVVVQKRIIYFIIGGYLTFQNIKRDLRFFVPRFLVAFPVIYPPNDFHKNLIPNNVHPVHPANHFMKIQTFEYKLMNIVT